MLGVGSNPDSRDAAWNWPGDHEAASWRLLLASVGVPVSDSPSPQASRWSLELRSMTGRSPGSQSVSQTVLFLAAFPLPGRAFVGNRARPADRSQVAAPDKKSGEIERCREPSPSMPAGAQSYPRHRPPHCDLSPSTGISWPVIFSLGIGGHLNICWSLPNETTRDRSSSMAPSRKPENRVSDTSGKGRLHTSAKGHRVMCAKGTCSPSGSCRERK